MKLLPDDVVQLQEMIDNGVEKAALLLSKMLNITLHLETEPLQAYFLPGSWQRQLKFKAKTPLSIIELNFCGSFGGTTALLLPPATTDSLASLLMHDASTLIDVEAARFGVVQEMGSMLINGVMSALSTNIPVSLDYATLQLFRDSGDNWARALRDIEAVLIIPTAFIVPQYNIQRSSWMAFEIKDLQALLHVMHLSREES